MKKNRQWVLLPLLCVMLLLLSGCCLTHQWREADCTRPQTCLTCGETKGAAPGHQWQAADCTRPQTCAVCGETKGTALGHTWQEADCTHAAACTTCGETKGDAPGHQWQAADCTRPQTCAVCGETNGTALGHLWQQPDCTRPQTCLTCGKVEGDAAGHDWQPATCTEAKLCRVCGVTEGEAAGHSYAPATFGKPEECAACGETRGEALGLKAVLSGTKVRVALPAPELTGLIEKRLADISGSDAWTEKLMVTLPDGTSYTGTFGVDEAGDLVISAAVPTMGDISVKLTDTALYLHLAEATYQLDYSDIPGLLASAMGLSEAEGSQNIAAFMLNSLPALFERVIGNRSAEEAVSDAADTALRFVTDSCGLSIRQDERYRYIDLSVSDYTVYTRLLDRVIAWAERAGQTGLAEGLTTVGNTVKRNGIGSSVEMHIAIDHTSHGADWQAQVMLFAGYQEITTLNLLCRGGTISGEVNNSGYSNQAISVSGNILGSSLQLVTRNRDNTVANQLSVTWGDELHASLAIPGSYQSESVSVAAWNKDQHIHAEAITRFYSEQALTFDMPYVWDETADTITFKPSLRFADGNYELACDASGITCRVIMGRYSSAKAARLQTVWSFLQETKVDDTTTEILLAQKEEPYYSLTNSLVITLNRAADSNIMVLQSRYRGGESVSQDTTLCQITEYFSATPCTGFDSTNAQKVDAEKLGLLLQLVNTLITNINAD